MVDVEEQVMDSNIDSELRGEISQAKQPGNKKMLYVVLGVVVVLIIGAIAAYFTIFASTKSTFTFYLNNAVVTENLNVKITFDGTTNDYVTTASTLEISGLPKDDAKFTIEVPTYNYKKDFFGGSETYRIDLKKTLDLKDETSKSTNVKFSVYTTNDSFNLYMNPVVLNLKCMTSGKSDSLSVNGSASYSKDSDCGALQINANVSGFSPYSGTCSEPNCSIRLSEIYVQPPVQTKNNLNIYVVDKETGDAVKDANVTVTRYGFTKTLITNTLGEAEFIDLETGSYSVNALVSYNDVIFTKTLASVNVETGILASTATIEFDFSNNNKINLLIDANVDLECQFGVDVIDAKYSEALDANIETAITFEDLNTGKYYMNIIPLGECLTVYSPIYNKQINYPGDADLTIKMTAFEKPALVLLDLKTKLSNSIYPGVKVSISESDNNRTIIEGISDEQGELPAVVALYMDKSYTIKGETSVASASMSYKYTKTGHTADSEGYYYDSQELILNIDGVNVKIHANIFDDKNISFDVLASWSDIFGTEQNIPFSGSEGLADVTLPTGTDILLKVSKDVNLDEETTYKLNYYLNKFNFVRGNSYDINVLLPFDYVVSLVSLYSNQNKFIQISDSNKTYFTDPQLNKSAKESNLANNKDYYLAFDVLPLDYSDEFSSDCVSGSNSGIGFIFSASVSNQNIADISDILAYTKYPVSHSTIGFDFKPVFVEKSLSDSEINIFRVVLDARIRDVNKGLTGYLEYSLSSDIVPDVMQNLTNEFTITNELAGESSPKYSIDLNLFMPTETKVTLPIENGIKFKLSTGNTYKVTDVSWFARNSLPACDPYVNSIPDAVDMLNLVDPFVGEEITKEGVVDVTIDPSITLKNYNLPLKLDLGLNTTIALADDSTETASYNLPLTLNLSRGDYPQANCLDIYLDDSLLHSKDVLFNDYVNLYYDNKLLNNIYLPNYDLNNDQKAIIMQYFNNLGLGGFVFLVQSLNNNAMIMSFDISSGATGVSNSTAISNYDLLLSSPKKVKFINNCSLWDFNVSYSQLSTDDLFNFNNQTMYLVNNNNRSAAPPRELDIDKDYNNIQFFSFYKNKYDLNNPNEVRVHSSSFAFIPSPVNKLLELPTTSKTKTDLGLIIPLETDYKSPDCNIKMCGREMVMQQYILNSNTLPVKLYLTDDNYTDPNFKGYGEYSWDGQVMSKKIHVNIADQLFYHLPIKFSDISETIYWGDPFGTCSKSGVQLYYSDKQYAECTDNGLESFYKLNYSSEFNEHSLGLQNKYIYTSTALAGSVNTLTNNIGLFVTPGIRYKICDATNKSQCIYDSNMYKFVYNKSDYNVYYFVLANGNYYLPSQIFLFDGNNISARLSNYSLIAFTNAKILDPKLNDMTTLKYSLTTNNNYDLSKISEQFNLGNIGYVIINQQQKLEYYYYWDLYNMFKDDSLPFLIRTSGTVYRSVPNQHIGRSFFFNLN